MIQKMIFRLEDEQRDDDSHKNWCDQEMGLSDAAKDHKTNKLDDLGDKIKLAGAAETRLDNEVKAANNKILQLGAYMTETTKIRDEGRKENKAAIEDAQAAQHSIGQAIATMTEYYKNSGAVKKEAWEFVQQSAPVTLPDAPSTWTSAYTGAADPEKQ